MGGRKDLDLGRIAGNKGKAYPESGAPGRTTGASSCSKGRLMPTGVIGDARKHVAKSVFSSSAPFRINLTRNYS